MSDRPTPNNLDERLTILLKSNVGTYAIRLLAGEARDEMRELKRQRDAAVEALKAADKHFADYLESIAPFASTEELKVELSQTRSGKLHAVIRAVLREIEGES